MSRARTLLDIAGQLARPSIARGTLRDLLELRRDERVPQPPGTVVAAFAEAVAALEGQRFLDEPELQELEARLAAKRTQAGNAAPHTAELDASRALARLCWVVVRARRPELVVETGVAAGYTSAHLLTALALNGTGTLHSIDPGIGKQDDRLGWLVDDAVRGRWTLHRRRSRAALPKLVAGGVDVFVHDGLHTHPTMRWEAGTAGAQLRAGGALLVDDAERNPAFLDWAAGAPTTWARLVETEFPGHHCGLALR